MRSTGRVFFGRPLAASARQDEDAVGEDPQDPQENVPEADPMISSANFTESERRELADAIEQNLVEHVLVPWFPRALQKERGGYHQNYGESWNELTDLSRSVVYQARLTWVAAEAMNFFPKQADDWRARLRHGCDYLQGPMWDAEHGGWYWEIGADSKQPDTTRGTEKHAYGIAFGIYASAAAYRVMEDQGGLTRARDAFFWLERNAHDERNGGYFEALTREGKPLLETPQGQTTDAIGTRYGLRSMNTHIHLMEAFTALYDVWPDPALRTRLEEVFRIVRDRMATTDGSMDLYFQPDWTPVPNRCSFGHDVETAFLLAEAACVLGEPANEQTWVVGRRLVDHALRSGWDERNGGFFQAGGPEGKVTNARKVWWTQAEGLNALLLMDRQFARADLRYRDAFLQQWRFIVNCQIDPKNKGWHTEVSAEGVPRLGQNKSHRWKDPYHQTRALMRCAQVLRERTEDQGFARFSPAV